MKLLTLCLVGLSIGGAYSAIPHLRKSCLPPNGGGLASVFKDFEDVLPHEEFTKIVLKAATSDPQVKAYLDYTQSEEYSDAILGIMKSPQFQDFMKFACEKLFIEISSPSDVSSRSETKYVQSRPGVVGMLLDLLDLVPFDKLEASFNERYSKDAYLREGVKNLHSEEFKSILDGLENLPEAQTINRKLQEIGVNIDEVKQIYHKFFYYILDN